MLSVESKYKSLVRPSTRVVLEFGTREPQVRRTSVFGLGERVWTRLVYRRQRGSSEVMGGRAGRALSCHRM